MSTNQPEGSGANGCGFIVTERNRYFTGKYMTARDFQAEQDYLLSRHRLHNHLLHGWGVVCGLEIKYHPDRDSDPSTDCARRWVVVQPGIAIDCCGHELTLEEKVAFELPIAAPAEAYDKTQAQVAPKDTACQDLEEPFLLCLQYIEKEIEFVPSLYDEGTCDPAHEEANRVREAVELCVICDPDEIERCWRASGGDPDALCRDDCADEEAGPGRICLEPDCPCGYKVPLALISPTEEGGFESGFTIDMAGRRELPLPADFLTRIVYHNWPHGGEVTLSQLADWDGQLRVLFDRKIKPADGYRTGVSEFTFAVECGGVREDTEFLPYDPDHPPALDNDRWAVFTIDPPKYESLRCNIAGNVVYVTLKCDFILDCHDNPVDGDHLAGRLPSGNGVPGGSFESWFRVVPDPVVVDQDWYQGDEEKSQLQV